MFVSHSSVSEVKIPPGDVEAALGEWLQCYIVNMVGAVPAYPASLCAQVDVEVKSLAM